MTQRAVEEHDGLSDFFDLRYQATKGDYYRYAFSYGRRKIDELLTSVLSEVPPGGHVLDVGCGTGEQLRSCSDNGFQVSGVEPAARLRAVAQDNVPQANIVSALSWDMPFEDGSVDLAISIEVLRYLETADFMRSLDELARVVRPGGRIFLTLVNRWASDAYWLYHRSQGLLAAIRGGKGPLHCEFSSPRAMRAELAHRGFDQVRAVGCMAGVLRLFYKLGVGPPVARLMETTDDRLSRSSWAAPLAGHLVIVARRSQG